MKRWLLGLFALSVLLAACGGSGGGGSDEDKINKAVVDFQKAFSDGKPKDAYGLISADSKKDCSLQEFSALLILASTFLGDDPIKVESVSDIKIDGNKATATAVTSIAGDQSDPEPIEFVKEGGKWRLVLEGGCQGFDEDSSSPEPTSGPSGTPTATPVLRSSRETKAPVTADSGNVKITVVNLSVSDYNEFYETQSTSKKRELDSSSDTPGAVTVGRISLKIDNQSGKKITFYPQNGIVVAGSEQVEIDYFLGDDIGGTFFPGVLKEGTVYFFLKRVPASQITSVTLALDAPYDENYDDLGKALEIKLEVSPK